VIRLSDLQQRVGLAQREGRGALGRLPLKVHRRAIVVDVATCEVTIIQIQRIIAKVNYFLKSTKQRNLQKPKQKHFTPTFQGHPY
jgi:hypothetical protein